MKLFFNILWTAIVSIALVGFIFYISLWFAWGRMIDPKTGFTIGVMIALLYFIIQVIKILKKQNIIDNEKIED